MTGPVTRRDPRPEESPMRSSNPVLKDKVFQGPFAAGERMTMNGTIAKTGLLLLLTVVTGSWTWNRFAEAAADGNLQAAMAAVSLIWISPTGLAEV